MENSNLPSTLPGVVSVVAVCLLLGFAAFMFARVLHDPRAAAGLAAVVRQKTFEGAEAQDRGSQK